MPEEKNHDVVLQSTCQAIVTAIAQAIDVAPENQRQIMRLPSGYEVGQQIVIDATEKGGLLNRCRLAILNVDEAPAGEAARIEYEHDKQGDFGVHRVYSVQSVRREYGVLRLLENFIADGPETVREADFRPISSETYAQGVVFKAIQDWTMYYRWVVQESHKH